MALIQSEWATRRKTAPIAEEAGGVVAERFEIDFADVAALSNGDIIELGVLPAHCTIVDYYLDNDDLDSNGSPAANVDIGIMSGDFGDNDAARTCGDELFDGSTALQAAAFTRATVSEALRIAATDADRSIGVKFVAAPATQPASGVLALTVFYKQ